MMLLSKGLFVKHQNIFRYKKESKIFSYAFPAERNFWGYIWHSSNTSKRNARPEKSDWGVFKGKHGQEELSSLFWQRRPLHCFHDDIKTSRGYKPGCFLRYVLLRMLHLEPYGTLRGYVRIRTARSRAGFWRLCLLPAAKTRQSRSVPECVFLLSLSHCCTGMYQRGKSRCAAPIWPAQTDTNTVIWQKTSTYCENQHSGLRSTRSFLCRATHPLS